MTNPFLSAARRRPARLVLLALLIGVMSFAFISRVVEGVVVAGELNRLEGFYHTVGSLRPLDSQTAHRVPEAAQVISKSAYLALEDRRRAATGVLDGVYNSDISGLCSMRRVRYNAPYDYPDAVQASDVLFAGVLSGIEFSLGYGRYGGGHDGGYKLYFDMDTLLAGYPDYFGGGTRAVVWYPVGYPGEDFDVAGQLKTGGRYLIRAYFDRGLAPDDNRDQHLYAYQYLSLMPLAQSGPFCMPLEPGEAVDLSAPGLEGLEAEIALVDANQHAVMLVTTADMSAMPQTQPASRVFSLEAGRWLDSADAAGQSPVCVISADLARLRGLSVGDTLSLTALDVRQPYFGYIPDDESPYWQSYEALPLRLEIVGIYSDVRLRTLPYPPYMCYSNILYIPRSLLPDGFGSDTPTAQGRLYGAWDYYSFVLKSPYDQEAFLAENREDLGALGMEIVMAESGALNFLNSATPIRTSMMWSCLLFGLVLVLALLLAGALYLHWGRQGFALLRALGMPKGAAVGKLLSPFWAASGVAIALGGVLAWRHALAKAAETLAAIPGAEGAGDTVGLSPTWLAALCAAVFAALLALTLAGAWARARRPVLEALQGTAAAKAAPRPGPVQALPENAPPPARWGLAGAAAPPAATGGGRTRRNRAGAHARFILKDLWRDGVRSLLAIMVAAAFVFALGWMNRAIERSRTEIDRLYSTITITFELARATAAGSAARDENGNEANYIGRAAVDGILETGYIQGAQLTAYVPWSAMTVPLPPESQSELFYQKMEAETQVSLYGFSSAEALGSNDTGLEVEAYAPGYDSHMFAEDWPRDRLAGRYPPTEIPEDKWEHYRSLLGRRTTLQPILDLSAPILLEGKVMDRWGLSLGDTVYLYRVKGAALSMEVWLATAVVAGRYSDGQARVGLDADGTLRTTALIPISALETLERATKSGLGYASASFTVDPGANRDFLEAQDSLSQIINRQGTGEKAGTNLTPLTAVVWDSELRSVVQPLERNLELMSILYPIAVALSAVAAVAIGLLGTLQRAQAAAIMRLLGMPRGQAGLGLCCGPVVLAALGLMLGLAAVALQGRGTALEARALANAGLYLWGAASGAGLGAFRTTGRRPLELVQAKK